MSSTVRGSGHVDVPRPRRDPNQRRWSVVYGIPTLPVDQLGRVVPGPPVVGYVGKSVQTVKQREAQHRAEQPFGDLICGGSWVIEEGLWTEAELDARERYWIRHGVVLVPGQSAQRPVYNYDWNLDNPLRVEKWRAVEQRRLREPGWEPKPGFVVRVQQQPRRVSGPAVVSLWRRVRWTRRRVRAALLVAVWLALFAGFWWAGWDVWPGWDGPRNSAIGASVVLAATSAARQWAKPKRRRRRRARR